MSFNPSEHFSYPHHGLGPIEALDDRRRVRDALVARLDGYRPLHIDVDIPIAGEPVPVVAWVHGGGWQWGTNKLDDGPIPSKEIRERLLARGIAFAAVEYRLAAEATWPAQLHDVKSAIRWLRHYATPLGLDSDRIAIWGESAGGHLAALVATTSGEALDGTVGVTDVSSQVIVCVDWYGASDLNGFPGIDEHHPVMALLGGDLKRAAEASPITHVDATAAPILLIHGGDDSIVPPGQSASLAQVYQDHGVPAGLEIVAGVGHAFAGSDPDLFIDPSIAFLSHHLGVADAPIRLGSLGSVASTSSTQEINTRKQEINTRKLTMTAELTAEDDRWLNLAVELAIQNVAHGGGPFGAVLVKNGELASTGQNNVTRDNDPTAHAEVVAIRNASKNIEDFNLAGHVLYSSCEPCPMCLASSLWARVERVVYAADRHDAAEGGFDDREFYELFARDRDTWETQIQSAPVESRNRPFDLWRDSPSRIDY